MPFFKRTPESDAAVALVLRSRKVARQTKRALIESMTEEAVQRLPEVHFLINERAKWKAHIDAATEGGRVGLVRAGMDCDCCQYRYERVIDAPVSVFAWMREYEKHCEWLDGPESTFFLPPSQVEDGRNVQRDLALEAFEDGHPHCVHPGDL